METLIAPPPADTTTCEQVQQLPTLIALGFCGIDDSVHPHQIIQLSHYYPQVEFGILFRPDKEGTPRYASKHWVDTLGTCIQHYNKKQILSQCPPIKLAAHLCGSRVNDLLQGNQDCYTFLDYLYTIGITRIQINATQNNGVDTRHLSECVATVLQIIHQYNNKFEFIIQKNEETKPLWEPIEEILFASSSSSSSSSAVATVDTTTSTSTTYNNISMLLDESKGTGITSNNTSWPKPPSKFYTTGYAGGIGPSNVRDILSNIIQLYDTDSNNMHNHSNDNNSKQYQFWIDMESSLRSIKNNKDIFDLNTCHEVIMIVTQMKFILHRPEYLLPLPPLSELSSSSLSAAL